MPGAGTHRPRMPAVECRTKPDDTPRRAGRNSKLLLAKLHDRARNPAGRQTVLSLFCRQASPSSAAHLWAGYLFRLTKKAPTGEPGPCSIC